MPSRSVPAFGRWRYSDTFELVFLGAHKFVKVKGPGRPAVDAFGTDHFALHSVTASALHSLRAACRSGALAAISGRRGGCASRLSRRGRRSYSGRLNRGAKT
jgi:hypothetical protein